MRGCLTWCRNVALAEIFRSIFTDDFHCEFDFRVDVDAVVYPFSKGVLSVEADGVACKYESLTDILSRWFTHVLKGWCNHQIVDFIRSQIKLDAIVVPPNLDITARYTREHGVEGIVKVLHLQFGLEVLTVHANNTPVDSDGNVEYEI